MLRRWVEFFDHLQNVKGRSLNTVKAYRQDLSLYEEFLSKKKDISFFNNFMSQRKLSPRSQARVVSSLRSYFKFCQSQGDETSELRQLRSPKVKKNLPKALSREDFQKLYEACAVKDLHKTTRNELTLLLLYGLGCRVSEMIGLSLQDYNSTEAWLSVMGKGGKQRLIPVTDELQSGLELYLKEARPQLALTQETSLLVNDRGRRPSRVDIWRWLAAWSLRGGFADTVHPHQFRHGCATGLLERGADLRTIQMLLGHSSIQTTQIYTQVTTQHLQKEVETHHPLSGLQIKKKK